ncbi:ogr/Delta-like zinc finger family protein [Stenotrophomonas indicatrix]|uniref:Ogr/Delta-like zinc finger family protein n=1 Tax=Stenotrophomonas indicatrix TaxID=2045451 RepID=A0ABT8QEM4_9GAMM|nr:ogr/Delta-like zinc finger family protein [Stenotrophomonas indicatrix]MDN8662399.1 ogr/Delta-like zinc finger family protein [Stenotrophomonas indicatrix]MDN8670279.1 ogr/Delta-like zinc finger family protein [Stenotrophomonas indicatrix]
MNQSRAFLRCPHCDAPAVVRSSCSLSRLLRESLLQCRNALCGHTFSAYTEIVRTHSPSACPRGDVDLPLSTPVQRIALAKAVQPQDSTEAPEVGS